MAELGLQDSKWSLVLIYPTITVPVSTRLLVGLFRAIPRDVEEQAMVDGYSRLAAFGRIAVPLAFAFNLLPERFVAGFAMGAVKG